MRMYGAVCVGSYLLLLPSRIVVWRDAAQSAARLRPAKCEPTGRTARESEKYSTAQCRRKERAGLNARWR